ncbi:KTSC domain-containing protein [Telmatospirillum sp.]|uniref:KTSC domain-containing protein n=1 Tax=Telmatospirillum sp. TaxID=2079197 RepID=UPI002847EDB0|nr:KTSC domain-containing protein [Telmatospirillum sp.]MDR3436388.1 KTSC domain-containing protein [Telmatospirillum sp.]
MTTRMYDVESSNLQAVGYDPANETLQVSFKHGGLYGYKGVPPVLVTEMLFSESVGKFFDARIKKGCFPFEKLH